MGAHDKAFRRLMKEDGAAEALLRERLPRGLVRRFAGPPEQLSESFIDEKLDGQVADVVFRVPLRGGTHAFVYCLVEHKRTEDRFVLVQVLRYLTALYDQLSRTKGLTSLPAVVPLLVFNGERRWRGPRRFSELIDAPPATKRLTIDFEVVVIDLGAESIDHVAKHPTLRGGLLGLKAAATRKEELPSVLTPMFQSLAHEPSTLALFVRYLTDVAGRNTLPLIQQASEQQEVGKEKVMQTISEFLQAKGYRKGARHLAARTKAARGQGVEEGLRVSLARVLTKRFKRVPPTVQQRLDAADAPTLTRWLDAALDAKSLKAVFTEP